MFSPRQPLAPALIAAVMGCGVVIGLEAPQGQSLPPLPETASDPCAHVAPPPPPPKDDDGDDLPPFWLALRRTYLGASGRDPDAAPPGFDLDGVCTCDRRPGSAYDGGPSCIPRGGGAARCDFYDGGIDNEIERIFANYAQVFAPHGFDNMVNRGQRTVLVYVGKYNGQPNDRSVSVGVAEADGIYTDACDPALAINDGPPGTQSGTDPRFTASWRGCDRWHGVPDEFSGDPDNPDTYLPKGLGNGYVTNGVLVFRQAVDVPVLFAESASIVQDPIIVSPLERIDPVSPGGRARFRMNGGTLAGRMALAELAKIVFVADFDDVYICQQPEEFKSLMKTFCESIDSAGSAALDHQGKTCGSISFAFRYDADPVDLDRSHRDPAGQPADRCAGTVMPSIDTLCPP